MTPLWTADVIIIAQLGFPRERESGKEKSPDQGQLVLHCDRTSHIHFCHNHAMLSILT
jgi:hypothetical protein